MSDHDNSIAWTFFGGVVLGVIALAALLIAIGGTPKAVQDKWCAEMFAAPQADTLAILRTHDFCEFPRAK